MRFLRVLCGSVVVLGLFAAGATPAFAHHRPTITHQPPPAAKAGQELQLAAAVEGCTIFCTPVAIRLHYRAPNGSKRVLYKSLGALPLQTVIFKVRSSDVVSPRFTYWLEASQNYCWFDACHGGSDRAPDRGSFGIPTL
ncbi:MAG: hypothetical protein M3280_02680 [Actinomycetota bacterium]|nr:hypothetical protein [Actinomycetota bacterium]